MPLFVILQIKKTWELKKHSSGKVKSNGLYATG